VHASPPWRSIDSGKLGVWPGNPDDRLMFGRSDGGVDYWDGER
jgi:hypothetical protein